MADARARIAANAKGAADAIALSGKFTAEEKKIHELEAFLQQRLVLSQFLIHLGSSLPSDLVIDSVDVRETGVNLSGTAAGSPVEAAGRTTAYLDLIQKDPYFKGLFEVNDVKQDVKREQSGRVTFTLSMRFKGTPKR